ncbi:MAG: hypothetical protein ACPGUC_07080 [Gammaproteobacteria bacterium]
MTTQTMNPNNVHEKPMNGDNPPVFKRICNCVSEHSRLIFAITLSAGTLGLMIAAIVLTQ